MTALGSTETDGVEGVEGELGDETDGVEAEDVEEVEDELFDPGFAEVSEEDVDAEPEVVSVDGLEETEVTEGLEEAEEEGFSDSFLWQPARTRAKEAREKTNRLILFMFHPFVTLFILQQKNVIFHFSEALGKITYGYR